MRKWSGSARLIETTGREHVTYESDEAAVGALRRLRRPKEQVVHRQADHHQAHRRPEALPGRAERRQDGAANANLTRAAWRWVEYRGAVRT